MTSTRNDGIRISPVAGKRQLEQFITATNAVYRDDPAWVAPLRFELRQRLTPGKNPFFEHARWQAWTAHHDGRVVGRISAQIDDLYRQQHGEAVGYFGMLEAGDDRELFSRLLGTAEDWLRDQGIRTIRTTQIRL